jgi:hypothetical protein
VYLIPLTSFLQCVNDKTFRLKDILLSAENGNTNLTKDKFWAEEITTFFAGKSYSLIATESGVDFNFDLELKSGQNYSIFIPDPNYYLHTINPATIPRFLLITDDNKSQKVFVQIIQHRMMNKPGQPCESSQSLLV